MGCGCKKRKGVAKQKARDGGKAIDTPPKSIVEAKEYQLKVSEALKQFADMKIRKRHLRGK